MSVIDTSYLVWPRRQPPSRPAQEEWYPPAAAVRESASADRADPLRTLTYYAALVLVFIKFGMLAEIQGQLMGFHGYLLYIFGAPAAIGVLMAGGVRRTLVGRPAYYWLAFSTWMIVCVPFSYWKYGSLMLAKNFVRDDTLMLFVIAGLTVSWRECRLLAKAIGIAAVINIATGRFFANSQGGRLSLNFGTVANSNDYAAHLLLTLPFLLLFVYNSKAVVVRAGALLLFCAGILVMLRTASRGALIALIICAIFAFARASAMQRVALLCLFPIVVAAVLVFVPSEALQRIRSFSASESDASQEALESTDARRYVMRKGIEYTLEYPLFGVGPGQFPSYEGAHNKVYGEHGMWHEAHDAWIEASSECGIPGGILLLAGYISSFLMLNRTYRKARQRPDCEDIRNTIFCIMLGMVGFCVAITFLNFAYLFYGPALAGIAIAMERAANYEFEHRVAAPAKPAYPWPAPRFGARQVAAVPAAGLVRRSAVRPPVPAAAGAPRSAYQRQY